MGKLTSFDDFLDERYGKIGTPKRTEFGISAETFAIREINKEEHRLSKLAQAELNRFEKLLQSVRTDELSYEDITKEVEVVRQKRYENGLNKALKDVENGRVTTIHTPKKF